MLKEISGAILEVQDLAAGYRFCMPGDDEWKSKLEEFIGFERSCCSFLSFDLESADGASWLRITGPGGAKEFIRTELMMKK